MFEAVPKLGNKRKPLGRRQTNNLIRRKQSHGYQNSRQLRGREGRKSPFVRQLAQDSGELNGLYESLRRVPIAEIRGAADLVDIPIQAAHLPKQLSQRLSLSQRRHARPGSVRL